MKRSWLFSFAMVFIFLVTTFDSEAQRRSTRRVIETEDVYKENPFWWGINLGNLSVFNNQLYIGVAPMAGYKLTPGVSVGAIAEFSYYYTWSQGSSNSFIDYGFGVFGRGKLSDAIFAHVEFRKQNIEIFDSGLGENTRQWLDYLYVGGGYSSSGGGLWAYEISLLYNVLEDTNRIDFPFDYRIAFTYNF